MNAASPTNYRYTCTCIARSDREEIPPLSHVALHVMVNFKAAMHQGNRKRAQASQNVEAGAVTKAEKTKLLGKELAAMELVNDDGVALRVVAREKSMDESNAMLKAALVDDCTYARLCGDGRGPRRVQICRPGGDFLLTAKADSRAGPGEVLLSEAQRLSLHVCEDEAYEWVPYHGADAAAELAVLVIEAQLLHPPLAGTPPVEMDAAEIGRELGRLLFDETVSDNELFMASHRGVALVLRVTDIALPEPEQAEAAALAAAAEEEEEEGEEAAAAAAPAGAAVAGAGAATHCYRGLVTPQTTLLVCPSTVHKSSASQRAVSEGLTLRGVRRREVKPPRHVVLVRTSDGEEFPVPRQLLRPCIALTKAVRAIGPEPVPCDVDIDCLTFVSAAREPPPARAPAPPPPPPARPFLHARSRLRVCEPTAQRSQDRVLLFLEAAARGAASSFCFEAHVLEEMSAAARSLGCRTLQESVAVRLGDFESRVRMHRWADVVRHNDAGGWCAWSQRAVPRERLTPRREGPSCERGPRRRHVTHAPPPPDAPSHAPPRLARTQLDLDGRHDLRRGGLDPGASGRGQDHRAAGPQQGHRRLL